MQSKRGRDARFQEQLLPLLPKILAFARVLARHREDGEDLAQAAIASAWRARDSFDLETDLQRWLYRILRNEHISRARQTQRRGVQDSGAAELIPTPAGQNGVVELRDVREALQRLPLTMREALLLVGAAGHSYEEAADMIGCPVGTVKTRVFRARAALLALLECSPVSDASPPVSGRATSRSALSGLVTEVRELASASAGQDRTRRADEPFSRR